MKATEQLRAEHEGILEMVASMEAMAARAEGGVAVEAGEISSILDFLRVFVDRCHHGKEELLLFPRLEKAGLLGPVGAMLSEHESGRALVRAIEAASGRGGPELAGAIRAYAEFIREHIAKENQVLFPMADRLLGEEKQEELYEGFERIEEERIGAGRHEAFHALIGELARKYRGVQA